MSTLQADPEPPAISVAAPTAVGFQIDVRGLDAREAVSLFIESAADLKVSDLSFATNEDDVAVFGRHLGIYRLFAILDADFGRHCLQHIKALAGLDIAEHRRPQDGRWLHVRPGLPTIDLRINTLPTLYGEDCTLRILVRNNYLLNIEHLGLATKEFNLLLDLLHNPSGMILVTGPTGSGKTTTLYACLSHLNNGERKINTIEDPIEFALPGIRQAQINPHVNVDFPDLLRSVLRQAPDVIMIGEIRDRVTAETAVRAANSGHLVLATLHAPTSAGAVQSMLSFGVNPHFLGASLGAVLAQRLVRTLCRHCKTSFDVSSWPTIFDDVKPWLGPEEGKTLYAAHGCLACHKTGYTGRTGVFEVLSVGRDIRQLIFERQPTQVLRDRAVADGMIQFRQAALLKVARGQTSAEEVIRTIPTEYLGLE